VGGADQTFVLHDGPAPTPTATSNIGHALNRSSRSVVTKSHICFLRVQLRAVLGLPTACRSMEDEEGRTTVFQARRSRNFRDSDRDVASQGLPCRRHALAQRARGNSRRLGIIANWDHPSPNGTSPPSADPRESDEVRANARSIAAPACDVERGEKRLRSPSRGGNTRNYLRIWCWVTISIIK